MTEPEFRNLSPMQRRRLIDRLPHDNPPDAHDLNLPLTPPGITPADPRPESDRDRNARNPYLQSIAPPVYLFWCEACDERRAHEYGSICPQCLADIAHAGLIKLFNEITEEEGLSPKEPPLESIPRNDQPS